MNERHITIPKSIGKVCDESNYRYALGSVELTPHDDGTFLTATDSRSLVVVDVPEKEVENRCLMPADVLSRRKETTVVIERDIVTGRETFRDEKLSETHKATEGTFPRVHTLLTDAGAPVSGINILVNVELLLNVANAIRGDDKLVNLLIDADSAEAKIALSGPNGIGIVMPGHDENNNAPWNDYQERARKYAEAAKAAEAAEKVTA